MADRTIFQQNGRMADRERFRRLEKKALDKWADRASGPLPTKEIRIEKPQIGPPAARPGLLPDRRWTLADRVCLGLIAFTSFVFGLAAFLAWVDSLGGPAQ